MRFYTLPPRCFKYPFLFANIRTSKVLRGREFEHAIIDCGVHVFKENPRLSDYPKHFLWRYTQKAEILTHKFRGKVWIVIPDYPDDYHPGQIRHNIEKTLRNIEEFMSIKGVKWLPVLQSRYRDLLSFYESCERTRHLIGDYPRVAIGTVCKTKKLDFILECCKVARRFFPKSWIHAFGPTLKAVPLITKYINSYDSMSWGFPRLSFRKWSEKTGLRPLPNPNYSYDSQECCVYFKEYMKRLLELVPDLEVSRFTL